LPDLYVTVSGLSDAQLHSALTIQMEFLGQPPGKTLSSPFPPNFLIPLRILMAVEFRPVRYNRNRGLNKAGTRRRVLSIK
jgi:hypothetical protein